MKQRGFEVDEVLCFILVRLCYNRLRSAWRPGGYPPSKAQQVPFAISLSPLIPSRIAKPSH